MFDLDYIKNKLNNYGISFENYIYQTGNLVGKVNVPNALRAYNKDLTPEQAFYLVANKVYELANLLAFGIPSRLADDYKNVVGHEIYKDFQKAIYEEINQRFLSNTFPEFQNAGSVSISNVSINSGYLGGPSITDWVNPLSKQIIANIDWRQFTDEANYQRDKVFMYRNMENVLLPNSTNKRIMQVQEDGSIALENKEYFATNNSLEDTNTRLESTNTNSINNTSEINIIKSLIPTLATKEYVDELVTAFPKTEIYNEEKTYSIPSFTVFNKKIYWNLQDNNLGHIPGGITGEGWWQEITDIFIPPKETTIIYQAGTDIKKSLVNPNELWYIDIQSILDANIQNENDFFNLLNNMFNYHNLTKEQTDKLFENLCNRDITLLNELYGQKNILNKNDIYIFEFQDELEEFTNKYNLEINTDYDLLENNLLTDVTGSTPITGNIDNGGSRDCCPIWTPTPPNNRGLSFGTDGRTFCRSGGNSGGGSDGWRYVRLRIVDSNLNFDSATKIKSELIILKIKRNIKERKIINYYANIVDLTIEGHIIKTQGIENNDINQIATSAYTEIVNSSKTRSVEPKKGLFGIRRK